MNEWKPEMGYSYGKKKKKKGKKAQISSMKHKFYKVQFLENILFNRLLNSYNLIFGLYKLKVTMDSFLNQKKDSFCLIKLKVFLLLMVE